MATTTPKSRWSGGVIPLLMAYSVSLGPTWPATEMTTTSRPARTSMPGYFVSRRHRVRRRSSASSAFCSKVRVGVSYSGSEATRRSTPSWSSDGIPAKGSPGAAGRPKPPGAPPRPPPPNPPPQVIAASAHGVDMAPNSVPSGASAVSRRAPRRARPLLLCLVLGRLGQHLGVERCRGEELGVGAVGDDLVLVEQYDAGRPARWWRGGGR